MKSGKIYLLASCLAQSCASHVGCSVLMGGALTADDNWRHAPSSTNSAAELLRMRFPGNI